ncbi:MAG: type II secretion system F family protein [Bryobacteraceae bacterium]|nr:type II secretion system F family protein [Bryobacteraceae bacterium]
MTGQLGILAAFFAFVLASVSLAGYFLVVRRPAEGGSDLDGDGEESNKDLFLSVFHALGEYMPASKGGREAMQQRLHFAGYRFPAALKVYTGLKWGIGLLFAGLLAIVATMNRDDGGMALAAGICGLGIGFLMPERFLDARIRSRNDRLRRAIPPALDLTVMALEAGQNLDQALLAASRGLRAMFPDLSNELIQVHLQMRASKARVEALTQMAERNSEPELRKLCLLLVESDRFGTSLAPTLRQHARHLRVRFRQGAQEAARKLTVKMVFPVFFLIFPSILVVTLGPAALTLVKHLKQIAE